MRLRSFRPVLAFSMALRGLRRDPGSTTLAVTILALGLAAPTTFFSFLVGATRPLPVPEGDRVVRVDVVQPSRDARALSVSPDDFRALQGVASLEALGGYRRFGGTLVDREHAATRISGAALTPEVMPILRVAPEIGRIPSVSEADETVMLGHGLWHELFDGSPDVLGRPVEVNGTVRTVVGILPEGFAFPFRHNTWILTAPDLEGGEPFELVARLADGASMESAAAELDARWRQRDIVRDASVAGGLVTVDGFTKSRGEGGEAVLFGGLVLVALCLLLIACANVANLLLVRATQRIRALGIQSALGAGGLQVAGQLLMESVLVAIGGGLVGILMANAVVTGVERTLAGEHFGFFWMRMAVDGPVLIFTSILVVGTALVAGSLPAIRILGVDVQRVLKSEEGGSAMGGGGAWSRAFVTVQLALSCGAVVAAVLTARSLGVARDFGRELPAAEVLIATLESPPDRSPAQRRETVEAVGAMLGRIPGAGWSALGVGAPGYMGAASPIVFEGAAAAEDDQGAFTLWNAVTSGYFEMFDLEFRVGRNIDARDGWEAPRVAVVNESWVSRFSATEPVIGRRVQLTSVDSTAWFTVVGVVQDTPLGGGAKARQDRVYLPVAQVDIPQFTALVRSKRDLASIASSLREGVAEVDPEVAVSGVRSLEDAHAYMIRVPRTLAALAMGGGSMGLIVAVVGLYGLLAFRVRQQRRELGVRLALGADSSRLAREVLTGALRQLVPAVVVGLALAWIASPLIGALLLGLDPRGLDTYGLVGAGFLLTGLLAALGPALRAGAVDPARVLRGD